MYRLWKILLSNMSRPETFGMALVHLLLMLSTTIHHASIKMCHFYFWNNSMKNCLILILLLFGKQHHLRDDTIRHHCMDQPTVGKRVQWNRLWWFGHVCRIDDSRLPKQLLWAECPLGWRCLPNAPRKQWKNQVAADVTTHLPRRFYRDPLMAAASMTTEHGAWWRLQYDITGINRCHDQSSKGAYRDVSSVTG